MKFSATKTKKSRFEHGEWFLEFSVTKSISQGHPESIFERKIPVGIDILISTQEFFEHMKRKNISRSKFTLFAKFFTWLAYWRQNRRAEEWKGSHIQMQGGKCSRFQRQHATFLGSSRTEDGSGYQRGRRSLRKTLHISVTVLDFGRAQVCLPFKHPLETLGTSMEMARYRFLQLEKRPLLKEMCCQFMSEHLSLNHTQIRTHVDISQPEYFIPLHGALRPDSSTTKVRVVFDASATTSSNLSLNDIFLVGPTIQQTLILTLLSFRIHIHALTADILKIYRQFMVHPDDCKFQLIFRRSSSEQPLEIYQLNTVTFGMTCAPFLGVFNLSPNGNKNSIILVRLYFSKTCMSTIC
nr:uncharacterized protein LOC108006352 isoform X2 [Drosophila suzukii]XP_036677369.1 uncharacterized protein LOC108006352 isoform X2 [Drosophila suzukii]XP_036677370.1 uncharacterized protein LOC108006352 isoform X2 [Drosophila suzukii]XP_036677371.1 uncharacterized protein LOC108006352 isoform X2 [Drosophila suzukii]XP_036677372.1 uncharacterized protein LOC108006352 isoform X2 [Drosophila suzukii]XP_036677373.1 uncharacterized protein LOC108006352 isoform X2 [Drosophila suzukii]XP_03667737